MVEQEQVVKPTAVDVASSNSSAALVEKRKWYRTTLFNAFVIGGVGKQIAFIVVSVACS